MTKKNIIFSIVFVGIFLVIAVLGFFPSAALAESGNFEEQPSGTPTNQYIALDYLQRIEGTCFAEKISTFVYVPVYPNNKVRVTDVRKALGLTSFGVMQSYCKEITYDKTTNTYTAVYFKSVYLNAKTVDGNSNNYYLDCNLSFRDYFWRFVDSGKYTYTADDVALADADSSTKGKIKEGETVDAQVISEGLYEYFWNKIKLDGLQNTDYTPSDVYGYWGLIAVPQTYSLNRLWTEIFGTQTTFLGSMESFMYSEQLTWAAYRKLLTDYGYGFLSQVWNTIAGFFLGYEANFYVVYIDSEDTEFMIAENGADNIEDNSGAINNGIEDSVDNVKDFLADQSNVVKIFATIAIALLVFCVALAVIRLVKRLLGSSGRRR